MSKKERSILEKRLKPYAPFLQEEQTQDIADLDGEGRRKPEKGFSLQNLQPDEGRGKVPEGYENLLRETEQ